MNRVSRRAWHSRWLVLIGLLVPLLAACGGPSAPAASPGAASVAPSTAATASEAAEPSSETSAAPESSAAATDGTTENPSPINDKQFIGAFNQAPDTLFALESQSSVTTNVLWATGACIGQLSYDFQPTYCFDEFPTFENGGAISETVTVDPASINPESPIVVDGTLVTDTTLAEEAGITIPEELVQVTTTWSLNSELRWEDGTPVTAADYLEAVRVQRDPGLQGASRYLIDRLATVEATDDTTVVQTMVPGYLDNTYYTDFFGFVPAHIYGGQELAAIRDAESVDPFSFGPYMVEDYAPGESVTLVSNPYFPTQPKIGTVIWKFVADQDQLLAQLESGEIDYAGTIGLSLNQTEQLETLEANGAAVPAFVPGTDWQHIDFGIQRGDGEEPFFDDVRVRQAVAYAINRQEIIDQVLFGRTTAMNTYVPAEHPSYPGDDALEPYEHDPERAQELLEEAGWVDSDSDGIREKDGRPFSTSLYTTQGNRLRQAASEIIQQNLRDVGIELSLEFVDGPSVLFTNGADGILTGRRFDLALYTWRSGVTPSHLLYVCSQIPTEANGYAGQNNPGYCNPEFDEIASQALAELDREQRIELDQQAEIIWNRDIPAFPIFQDLKVAAWNPAVTGIEIDPTSFADLHNIENIDINR
jgi:peptide/nickel transport system substrate-binding protein